jgi:hypothetical protein
MWPGVAYGAVVSEPDSLYLRVRLSKQAYQRYLASPCADVRDFSDWMDWVGNAQMYGSGITPNDIRAIGERSSKRKTSEEVAAWAADAWNIGKSDYDEATETWRFGMLQFSENYYDFLEHLPLFRAVDRFKDRPGVDFLLVYNFLISPDDYVVFFEMTEGRSVIAGSPGQGVNFPNAYAEEAATFLTSLIPAG